MSRETQMNNQPENSAERARYIMIGGFLGAGKTTCMLRFARELNRKGLRVGLITNDQGAELVDTALLRNHGFPTAEIAGGCFCCRFESLADAARHLTRENRPDVILAEPVGSCTDLVATVSYPLRRIYGDSFRIAPLSVVVDPVRALRVLGLEQGAQFSEKVLYIYGKQLEEADLIVINKVDLLDAARLERLRTGLRDRYPKARIVEVSARNGQGLEAWFDLLMGEEGVEGANLPIDYETYAEGEALLGWVNCSISARTSNMDEGVDGNLLLRELAGGVLRELSPRGIEIAHFKMTFSPSSGLGEIGVINLVRNDLVPELSQSLPENVHEGEIIVNLRAEGDPDLLKQAVEHAVHRAVSTNPGLGMQIVHSESFRPGKPQPTHRFIAS